MTMRIHRAVRTLSLLLALSMLLSVSAISSAAETPAPSVLTVSDSTLALVDRDQAFTATLTVDASVLGDASPDAWAAGLTWYLTREEGFQDGTLYPYYYPGDRLSSGPPVGAIFSEKILLKVSLRTVSSIDTETLFFLPLMLHSTALCSPDSRFSSHRKWSFVIGITRSTTLSSSISSSLGCVKSMRQFSVSLIFSTFNTGCF